MTERELLIFEIVDLLRQYMMARQWWAVHDGFGVPA